MAKPVIVCAGMCNTKGAEIRYLAEQVEAHGGEPVIIDLSLGAAVDWADVSLAEVLASTGTRVEEVFSAPRATAIELVGGAGAVKIVELHARGRCDGIISWAGSVGTTTATRVMRALPFGVPKIMLTDMASSDVSMWLGNKDIYIANPTAEQGINVVTRKAVANAAAAIVAMALVPEIPPGSRPLVAITSYGTTTPTVLRCVEFMEGRGWDTAVFHAVGVGATMEDLIRSGLIGAIIDITPAELMNNLFGSVYGNPKTWEGERLTAAGEMGIPQIVVPGGLDQAALGPLRTVAPEYLDDVKAERRRSYRGTGLPYQHNDSVTIMLPTLEEVERVSLEIARKLNDSRGPTAFIIPMRGWSAYDQSQEQATLERGWAEGNGDGPTWLPDPTHPLWSRRATLMLSLLQKHLNGSNPNLDLLVCDMHILDPELADLLNRCMGDMLDRSWRKGLYRDLDKVIA
ncbi:MAG: Tm-1-like ATP-binding domain-containing protein [Candidatus Limnocylindrales bacterium]